MLVIPGHLNYRLPRLVVKRAREPNLGKPRSGQSVVQQQHFFVVEANISSTYKLVEGSRVLDLELEQQQQGQSLTDLYDSVRSLKKRYALPPARVHLRDSLAIRRDTEREQIHELVKRYREMPVEQQRRLPALLNSLGQLEMVIGEYRDAQQDFDQVAGLVEEHPDRADAHQNAALAALERRDLEESLAALLRACALDPANREPFPLARYQPRELLDTGAAGVAVLCTERDTEAEVVVLSLREDVLDRSVEVLFQELEWLRDLDHPALARIRAFGHAGPSATRPFVVLEHFAGMSLAEHIRRHGPLPVDEVLAILWPIARALQACHVRGVLHRTLNPSCIQIRKVLAPPAEAPDPELMALLRELTANQSAAETPAEGEADMPAEGEAEAPAPEPSEAAPASTEPRYTWQVRLFDAGLAVRRTILHVVASSAEKRTHTCLGRGVSRMLPYAPPELTGRPKGMVWVGPHSDIFAFGRLCWFLLTGRPEPPARAEDRPEHIPAGWWQLAHDCAGWTLSARPEHFGAVLDRLAELVSPVVLEEAETTMNRLHLQDLEGDLERHPADEALLAARARARLLVGEEDGALADYSTLLERQPGDASLYRRRGQIYLRRDELEAALADFTQAIEREPANAENWSLRAAVHTRRSDYQSAIADQDEVIKRQSKDETAWFNRGNSYFFLRDFESAIADYNAVLRLNPKNLWAHGNRGKAHANRGEHELALADFTQFLRLDPENARAYWDRGISLAELQRHEEAIADFTQAIERGPTAALYNDRGLSLASLNRHEEAIADFTQAHEMDPESAHALMYRGNSHCDRGDFAQALADLNTAAERAPELAVVFYNRGNVHTLQGDIASALADYTRAIELVPTYTSAYFNRANAHATQHQLPLALADYSMAISQVPDDPAAYNNRGNVHATLGDLDSALADFSEAVRLQPRDAVALFNRANILCRLGELQRALVDFTEVLRLDPNHSRAWNNRGNAHYDQGQMDNALADYNRAIECDPQFVRAITNRAQLLTERGDLDAAQADYSRALEIAPETVPAWYGRGSLRLQMGDLDGAVADLSEALHREPGHVAALIDRATAHKQRGQGELALGDLLSASEADPNSALAWFALGNLYTERGEYADALRALTQTLTLNPQFLPAYHNRGRVSARSGDYGAAVADNLQALEINPEDIRTQNNLAWLWATCPRDDIRDGARALELAQRLCERTGWKVAGFLDTLAAAHAECGQFAEASHWQQSALDLAPEAENDDYRARLLLYQQERAYRDDSTSG